MLDYIDMVVAARILVFISNIQTIKCHSLLYSFFIPARKMSSKSIISSAVRSKSPAVPVANLSIVVWQREQNLG